ncbi:hypothetical protein [Saccharopolyspora pogona]|uniref:hypothetical protein n=1 Tax=Saccharopolyspora pogona TaxID=333966 RepID=UPI0016823736|nr:hypothetical protein [Saccharopolyspora pogona]
MSIPADDLETHLVRVARDGSRPVGFYLLMIPGRGTDREGELDYLFVVTVYLSTDRRLGLSSIFARSSSCGTPPTAPPTQTWPPPAPEHPGTARSAPRGAVIPGWR